MPPPSGAGAFPATVANRFSVRIDNIETFFSELNGIQSEVENVDFYYNGSDGKPGLAKLPGKFKAPTISLKRGSDKNLKLWEWHEALRRGDPKASVSGSLLIYGPDASGPPVAIYQFYGAWCQKLVVTGVKAGGGEVLVEECVIMCEDLIRVS
jgi:phage tail-like protein